jgi:HAD superfamily hydrolase (TIGR01509 family)
MPARAVLFDWGGTLVYDAIPPHVRSPFAAALHAAAGLGVPLAEPQLAEAFEAAVTPLQDAPNAAPSLDRILGGAFGRLFAPPPPAVLEEIARAFADCDLSRYAMYEDARALLPSLRYRGYRLAIVANSVIPARFWGGPLARLGVAGYFDAVVSAADIGTAKPGPAPCLAALDVLGCPPADALFVGDGPATDVASAVAAGIPVVLLDRASRFPPDPRVLAHIHHLAALNRVLGERIPA